MATPIGNLDDISLRALAILSGVDRVAAEDTRATAHLLSYYGIKTRTISCHEHNELQRTPKLIGLLKEGEAIALVSNAGTPTISDPGYRLVEAAVSQGIRVIPIPGACAAMAALSASGLPTDSFAFIGFVPKKTGRQNRVIEDLAAEPRTLIFYESPRRLLTLIENLIAIMGDRRAVLARELTKIHEEMLRGWLSEIHTRLKEREEIKGECILLVSGAGKESEASWQVIHSEIEKTLETADIPLTELSRMIARKYGVAKSRIYEAALRLKHSRND